jgi:uncharacterized protein (DUF1810 family)
VFAQVCAELRTGRKSSHWMWFIFPQIQGLGYSSLSVHYAISGLDEAKAYLDHPILGTRLIECCRLVTTIEGQPIEKIFGHIDSLKFRSSLTLFARATADNQPFRAALEKYFQGKLDPLTIGKLSPEGGPASNSRLR